MEKPNFVYVTYIASTPEKVWRALIDTEVTRQYWLDPLSNKPAHVNVSDWEPGSEWRHECVDETRTTDIIGKVVESIPPSRLVLSWARPNEVEEESKHSRVTFDIEPYGNGLVRLIVTHEDLDNQMYAGISKGWPMILSNLKTFLESGHVLSQQIS
ncbi:SRPBCC family protein [Leptospira sp. 201903071]|uniref:SRPBCC family protein n=1 Tax=Leptospira ainazelensis TaxID=2810034 RepID=UPI00196584E6|nr:SRPBCC family protein [Leptospira ainazelensis]MBM9498657.1 SRPBCC family protein [Leptospira ainazelensis]